MMQWLAHHLFGKWKNKEFRHPWGNNGAKSYSSRGKYKLNNFKLNHITSKYIQKHSQMFSKCFKICKFAMETNGDCHQGNILNFETLQYPNALQPYSNHGQMYWSKCFLCGMVVKNSIEMRKKQELKLPRKQSVQDLYVNRGGSRRVSRRPSRYFCFNESDISFFLPIIVTLKDGQQLSIKSSPWYNSSFRWRWRESKLFLNFPLI